MAQKVEIHLVDDLDGSEATETVTFALDGAAYEIDLNSKNATKLRKSLTQFVESGRKVRAPRTLNGSRPKRSTQHIREWARANGMEVSDKGAIPNEVRQAYVAANG